MAYQPIFQNLDTNGIPTEPVVDTLLGNAYLVVRYVAQNMQHVSEVSTNMAVMKEAYAAAPIFLGDITAQAVLADDDRIAAETAAAFALSRSAAAALSEYNASLSEQSADASEAVVMEFATSVVTLQGAIDAATAQVSLAAAEADASEASRQASGVSAGQAATAKTAAETARDAAMVAGKVYATTADGLANTSGTGTVNRYFSTPSADSAEYLILYLNSAGVAVEQKRYPSSGIVSLKANVVASERNADYANTTRNQFSPNGGPSGPETLFGSSLIAYFGPRSRQVSAVGADALTNVAISKVYGAGAYGVFTGAGVAGAAIYRYFFSSSALVLGLKASVSNEFITIAPASGAGAEFLGGKAPMLFICWDGGASSTIGTTVLFSCGNVVLDAYYKTVTPRKLMFRMLVGGVVTHTWESNGSYDDATMASLGATLQGYNAAKVAWLWDTTEKQPKLYLNNVILTPLTSTAGVAITGGDITIGPILRCYSVALASNHSAQDWERIHAWHQEPMRLIQTYYDLDVAEQRSDLSAANVPIRKRPWALPATVGGPYDKSSGLTLSTVVQGSMPTFTVPTGPNMAPWTAPHDRTILDASVGRFNIIEHPDYPGDTTKALVQVGANYTPAPGVYAPASTLLECLDTTVLTENWTRLALNRYTRHASANTSVANNLVAPMTPTTFGRILDMTPWFPTGFPITGYGTFKYLFHDEYGPTGQEAIIYATNDPRTPFESWSRLTGC